MSPVSRGRKKKGGGRSPGGPDLRAVFGELVREFVPLVSEPDPLQVELITSDVIGEWWQAEGHGDPERTVGLGLIEYASGKTTPAALALLRAMRELGVTQEQRDRAWAGAERLAARGLVEPSWAAELGRVTAGECWRLADVFGDEATLLTVFERGGVRHGVVMAIAFSHFHHRVLELFVTDEPDQALADLRAQVADSDGVVVVERVAPEEARRIIEDGLGRSDEGVPESVAATRALALARCRVLPEPEPAPPPPRHTEAEREAIVRRFFAEAATEDLPENEHTRACVRAIVDYGCDHDSGQPLRVGPGKFSTFLTDWVPDEDLPEDEQDAQEEVFPNVLRAWVRWAAGEADLPDAAREELFESIEENIEDFLEGAFDEEDDEDDFPIESYLDGTPGDASLAELRQVLARRQFAMPFYVADGEGGEPEYLDPADRGERHLLVASEHPGYLDGPESEVSEGEPDPRILISIKETVVDQLWDDDPPEAWQAAKRLLDAGHDRDEILAELGGVLAGHLPGAAEGEREEVAAYRKELGQIR